MTFSVLATICSALVLIFTLLSNNQKERDSKRTQDDLKQSVDDVSESLVESLGKTSKIIQEIDSLGANLSEVRDSLNQSLTEAKSFQKLVDEQVRIEKVRFEIESANIVSDSDKTEFVNTNEDPTKYFFIHTLLNKGQRNGILMSYQSLLLRTDNNLKFKEEYLFESDEPIYTIIKDGYFSLRSYQFFDKDFLMNTDDKLVFIIRYAFQDEILKKLVEKTKYFCWHGYSINGYKFNILDDYDEFETYFQERFGLNER